MIIKLQFNAQNNKNNLKTNRIIFSVIQYIQKKNIIVHQFNTLDF